MSNQDFFSSSRKLEVGGKNYRYYDLNTLEEQGLGPISKLPFSIKVLLEAAVRQYDGRAITEEHVKQIAGWSEGRDDNRNSFHPGTDRAAGFYGRSRSRGSCCNA